jgi:hypothetical protein
MTSYGKYLLKVHDFTLDDIKFTKYGFINHDQCWLSIGWHVKIIDFSLKVLLRVPNQKFELKVCWGCHVAMIFHLSMNVFWGTLVAFWGCKLCHENLYAQVYI